MTDSEITKAFKNCLEMKKNKCRKCPYKNIVACAETMFDDLLALINRQKAEIDCLQKELHKKMYDFETEYDSKIKTEAIKEFDELLKEDCLSYPLEKDNITMLVDVKSYNNLLKKMVGD